MSKKNSRIEREKKTVEAMIKIYCSHHHKTKDVPCPECQALLVYALVRLDGCPFHEDKTTCAECPVHCYKPEMREKVRIVMRYSGPRMIYHHPILVVHHIRDGFKRQKVTSKKGQ